MTLAFSHILDFLSVANKLIVDSLFSCKDPNQILDWISYLQTKGVSINQGTLYGVHPDSFQELKTNAVSLFQSIKTDKSVCLIEYDPNFFSEFFPSYQFTPDGESLISFGILDDSLRHHLQKTLWNLESLSGKCNVVIDSCYENNKANGILDCIEADFIANLTGPAVDIDLNTLEQEIVDILHLSCIPVNDLFVPYSSKMLLYFYTVLDVDRDTFPKFSSLIDYILKYGHYNLQIGELKAVSSISDSDTGLFFYTSNENFIRLVV